MATIKQLAIQNAPGGQTINGTSGNDALMGGSGDDRLYGGNGDDVLEGGSGNDYLQGQFGSDVYKFGRGSGQDSIYDYEFWDQPYGYRDTVEFAEDIRREDLDFIREGDNLKIAVKGAEDTLTIQGWFSNSDRGRYRVEQLKFADGTVLTPGDLDAMRYTTGTSGTTGNDSLTGTNAKEILNGGAGGRHACKQRRRRYIDRRQRQRYLQNQCRKRHCYHR